MQAAHSLDGLKGANSDQDAGIAIVRRSLEAPLRQIAQVRVPGKGHKDIAARQQEKGEPKRAHDLWSKGMCDLRN